MFRPHWVILRPSKKTDPILHVCFTETHCGMDPKCSQNIIEVQHKL